MNKTLLLLLISSLYLLIGCESEQDYIGRVSNARFKQIETSYIVDKALDVFSVDLKKDKDWILSGETTDTLAAQAIKQFTDSLLGKGSYQNTFTLLPDTSLGDSTFGLVIVSVTPLRREPKHAAEILDQVIMGNALQILQKNRGWYQVRNHYNYIGWINKTAITRIDQEGLESWKQAQHVQVKVLTSYVYEKPTLKALHLSDLVLNATLKRIRSKGAWIQVELPDGESGFVPSADVMPALGEINPGKVTADEIIDVAKSMLGVPYLWGGKSSKANDCSGFTQTVFKANGIQLARDARQQALQGRDIGIDSTLSNVQPGDLLFFGVHERITHVGISLGSYEFIHQDSDVHIDSFNPEAENFNAFRKKTLKKIKRIIK